MATLGLAGAGELVPAYAQGSTVYRDTVLAEAGLVSYWRAAEAAGASAALDEKGGNRGRYRNGPRLGVTGLVPTSADTAAQYGGKKAHVRIRDAGSLDLRSSFTLEAWVKPLTLRKRAPIMRKDDAYLLAAERRNVRLSFWDRRDRVRTLVARRQLVAGQRHHLVGAYNRGRMRLYVDGKLVERSRLAARTAARASTKPLTIGGYRGQRFHGVIDEAAVYKAPLTAAEVTAHYVQATGISASVPPATPSAPSAPPKTSPAPSAPPEPDSAPASLPNGSVLWNGDFEAGNFSQYSLVQGATPDRITAAATPARKGSYAARLTAYDGDLQGGSNPRAQLLSAAQHFPGQEHYVGWSTYFPADFPARPGGFFVFFQFHGKPWSGSPTLGWGVSPVDGRIELRRHQRYGYDRVWSAPLARGRWVDFVARVNWSKDESVGFVELWVDGVRQTFAENGQQRLHTQTVMSDQASVKTIPTNYRQKGIIPGAVTIYHDEVKVGTSYSAVAP